MTPEETHSHALRFRRFQQSREKFFAPLINAALHKQYLIAAQYAPTMGVSCVQKIDSARIAIVIKHLYLDAGIVYGAKIRADFAKQGVYKGNNAHAKSNFPYKELKARGAMGFSERMHQLIKDYFRLDILNVSEGITQTTRELIRQVFTDAYASGYSINEIVKQLENTELSKIRARKIARSETVTAANKGAFFVAKDTGLLLNKTWLATKDKRTRDTHKAHTGIDGHTVGRDDYFIVGGYEMLHPGDRGGHDGKLRVPPEETINCRCTHVFSAVRDSNGRLIRA